MNQQMVQSSRSEENTNFFQRKQLFNTKPSLYLFVLLLLLISYFGTNSFGQALNSQGKMTVPAMENGQADVPLLNEINNEYNLAAPKERCLISFNDKFLSFNFSIPAFKDFRLNGSTVRDNNNIWEKDDHVEIFVQVKKQGPYYQYVVNTAGGVYDSRGTDKSWNGNAVIKTSKKNNVWNIKVKIPFSDFSFTPKEMSVLRGNVAVVMQSIPPTAVIADDNSGRYVHTWCATGKSFHNASSFGEWTFSSHKPFVKEINVKQKDNKLFTSYIVASQGKSVNIAVRKNETIKLSPQTSKSIHQQVKLSGTKTQVVRFELADIFHYCHYVTNFTIPTFDIHAQSWNVFTIEVFNHNKLDKNIVSVLATLDDKLLLRCGINYLSDRKINLPKLKTGKHVIKLKFFDKNNQLISYAQKVFTIIEQPPIKYTLAELDASKSYPSVKFSGNKVSTARSKYDLRNSILPEAIMVDNVNILKTPISLKFMGKTLAAPKVDKILQRNKNQIVLSGSKLIGDKKITVTADYQFDGFVWYKVNINSKKPFRYGSLQLEIPLILSDEIIIGQSPRIYDNMLKKGAYPLPLPYKSKYMSYTDILSSKFNEKALPYSALVWLGTDENERYRGLCFITEGPKGWNLKQYDKMYSLKRSGASSIDLKVNISDGQKAFLTRKICFSFGLQPFPIKQHPFKRNLRIDCTFMPDDYKKKYEQAKAEGKETLFFDLMKNVGANTELAFEKWTEYQSYWKTNIRDEDMKAYVKAAHEMNLKVMFYFGFLISNMVPEFPFYHDLILVKPTDYPCKKGYQPYLYHKFGDKNQSAYSYCHNSFWSTMMADGIAQAIERYDMDGVYLDGGFAPEMCCNAAHNCGVIDKYGRIVPTNAVRKSRRTLQMLYQAGQKHNNDFIIESHLNHPYVPFMSLIDSYFTGEAAHLFEPSYSRMSPAVIRGSINGALYGVSSELLLRPPYHINTGWGQSLLVNTDVRLAIGGGKYWCDTNKKVWQLRDKYNLKNDDFVPFFSGKNKIYSNNSDVLISYFDTKDVLIIIASNYWNDKANSCSIDLKALTGSLNTNCEEIWYNRKVTIRNGEFTTNIPTRSLHLFVVKK